MNIGLRLKLNATGEAKILKIKTNAKVENAKVIIKIRIGHICFSFRSYFYLNSNKNTKCTRGQGN